MATPIRALVASAAAFASLLVPAAAQTPDLGAYLAGRYAALTEDLSAAAPHFSRALAADPERRALQHDALAAYIGADDFESALTVAQMIGQSDQRSQLSNSVKFVELARLGEWRAVLERLEAGYSAGPLLDGLLRAWAHYGQGNLPLAFSAFDEMIEDRQQRPFGQFHKALALSLSGDFKGAEEILQLPPSQGVPPTRQAVVMRVQALSQLGEFELAQSTLDHAFGADTDSQVQALREGLTAATPLAFDVIDSPTEGIAEAFYALAQTVAQGEDSFVALLYARMTQWTNPTHDEALIATARLLTQMGQYDLALQSYAKLPPEAPSYLEAQTGRAMILRSQSRADEAIALLQDLEKTYPHLPLVAATLADTLRAEGHYAQSRAAYDRALEKFPSDAPGRWMLYFSRAVAAHEADDWAASEADLRTALALNPRQPSVLNYLGYSLIDQSRDLEAALEMIEQAFALEPNSGAIIDSLGWAYFRLGRYQDAVVQLERAVTFEATSYEINDHLGDAYWAVGRHREAQFQWRRALSFARTEAPEAMDRIQDKLERGLDSVLLEEGSPALRDPQKG